MVGGHHDCKSKFESAQYQLSQVLGHQLNWLDMVVITDQNYPSKQKRISAVFDVQFIAKQIAYK